jgi:hypothetical protein
LADVATQRKTWHCASILCVGNEAQCHAVVAESLAGGIGTIVKDVAMMAPAVRAVILGARIGESVVAFARAPGKAA